MSRLLLIVLVLFSFFTGCRHVSEPPVPTGPTAKWTWDAPSPMVPPMAWVAAGPHRMGDRTPENVDAIVIHTTEGRFLDENTVYENQQRNFAGVINYFKANDRNVSAHYVMGPNGEICQMVNEGDIAHTQTYYNGRGFGIECAGWSRYPEMWTPELLDSLVDLCAYLCVKWEIPAYHPEGTAYEGPYSVKLDEEVQRFVGPGLVGHFQVQPWNKSDPGEYFPWEEFAQRVREKIIESGAEPIPLPSPEEQRAKVTYVNGKVVDENIEVNKPLTYRLVIHGPGAEAIKAEDVVWPDLSVLDHVEAAADPKIVESQEGHVVFEFPIIAREKKNFNLTASRVELNGKWEDSGTDRVRFPE